MIQLHGTVVADPAHLDWGVLIIGPSGSGKSGLALQLLAYGCRLVSDDLVELNAKGGQLFATNPSSVHGIEARGIGILKAPPVRRALLRLVVDMGTEETERLPPHRHVTYQSITLPLVHKSAHTHFAAAILQYMRHGRVDQDE